MRRGVQGHAGMWRDVEGYGGMCSDVVRCRGMYRMYSAYLGCLGLHSTHLYRPCTSIPTHSYAFRNIPARPCGSLSLQTSTQCCTSLSSLAQPYTALHMHVSTNPCTSLHMLTRPSADPSKSLRILTYPTHTSIPLQIPTHPYTSLCTSAHPAHRSTSRNISHTATDPYTSQHIPAQYWHRFVIWQGGHHERVFSQSREALR